MPGNRFKIAGRFYTNIANRESKMPINQTLNAMPCAEFIAINRHVKNVIESLLDQKNISKTEADKMALVWNYLAKRLDSSCKGWMNIKQQKWIKLLGRASYAKILRFCTRTWLLRDNSYLTGSFSKACKIKEEFADRRNCDFWYLSNQHCIRSINQLTQSKYDDNDIPALLLLRSLNQFRLTGQSNVKDCWTLEAIRNIQRERFYIIRDQYGRLHHNYTNISKAVRQTLTTVSNARIRSIDVRNSQPLILGLLQRTGTTFHTQQGSIQQEQQPSPNTIMCTGFMNNESEKPTKIDTEKWIKICEEGRLYETIQDLIPANNRIKKSKTGRLDLKAIDRGQFKRLFLIMLMDTLAENLRCPIFQTTCKEFPSIADHLIALKSDDHANAARTFQKMESWIFIDNAFRSIVASGLPAIPIHDAVMTEDIKTAKVYILKAFETYGLRPTLAA